MRITKIIKLPQIPDTELFPGRPASLFITFVDSGVEAVLPLPMPADWDIWTRQQRVEWGRQQVADHLIRYNYAMPQEVIYPDLLAPESAKGDFEALPGWATWSAAEAVAYIEANVTTLATAKTVMERMAQAIVYLRDMSVER